MKRIFGILIGFCAIGVAATATPFGVVPDWESNDVSASERVILADFNGDGLFDVTLACHKSTGYPDGGPNKVFYNNGTGVGVDDETPNTPAGFALYQSYPNPMHGSATIAFALPHTGHVNLEVFDIKGRKVSTLVSETLNEGEHEASISGLSAGIYLYRFTAGENSAVRKMVVR